jgi:nitroimidazol reductase NimA-like FMN-containing flavoprotein (pyridoxamine 5'-phosphate oxidase superfamily)
VDAPERGVYTCSTGGIEVAIEQETGAGGGTTRRRICACVSGDDDEVSARPESNGCGRPGKGANVTQEQDLAAIARSIVDANRFMVLGTADASGRPWVSPVWYALLSYREYVWVSRPGTRHSRNLAARPEVAIAIYDSHRPGDWSAFYTAAVAEELEDVDIALEAFNRRSEAQGLRAWSRAEVVSRGEFRLYRATAGEQFVLDDHDRRLPVHLE